MNDSSELQFHFLKSYIVKFNEQIKEKLENVIMQTDSNHQKIIASYNNLLTIFIMRLCEIEP